MAKQIETIGDNYEKLVIFCKFLVRMDEWTAEQILGLLDSPHRWQAEYTFYWENKDAMDSGELTNGEEEEESGINYSAYSHKCV